MEIFRIIICTVIAYLIGGLNPSYVIAKMKGFDIRKRGSGNAGASNAVITMGKKAGAVCAVFDIFKAYFCVKAATALLGGVSFAGILCGSACILGHIFPIYMGFRGGKGLACLGGTILGFDYRVFLVMIVAEFVLALVVDYICVVPTTAAVVFVPVIWIMTGDAVAAMIFAVAAVVILFKHVGNIKRIINGKELHFSFLWRREEEIERIKENSGEN